MAEPRGAGRGGGLLFLAVVAFVAYLVVVAVTGVLKFILGAVLTAVLVLFALSVLRRR